MYPSLVPALVPALDFGTHDMRFDLRTSDIDGFEAMDGDNVDADD
jgi:hypothetical protein